MDRSERNQSVGDPATASGVGANARAGGDAGVGADAGVAVAHGARSRGPTKDRNAALSWEAIHGRLLALARRKADYDAEEGTWLVRGLRAGPRLRRGKRPCHGGADAMG